MKVSELIQRLKDGGYSDIASQIERLEQLNPDTEIFVESIHHGNALALMNGRLTLNVIGALPPVLKVEFDEANPADMLVEHMKEIGITDEQIDHVSIDKWRKELES